MRIAAVLTGVAMATMAASAAALAQAPFQDDRDFVDQATSAGVSEITAGQLAQKQGSPGVRVFGRWMVADHTFLGALLADRATEMGLSLPGQGVQTDGTDADMANLHGAEFDQKYLEQQVEGHQKVVTLFEHQSASGHDAALKRIAQDALPLIREHMAVAQDLLSHPAGN